MLATRIALRELCTIERDSALSTPSAWNAPSTPSWSNHLAAVPCRSWAGSSGGGAGSGESVTTARTAVLLDRRVVVPLGTDVTEADRVASITYRGTELLDGPMLIEAVVNRTDHLELILKRVR